MTLRPISRRPGEVRGRFARRTMDVVGGFKPIDARPHRLTTADEHSGTLSARIRKESGLKY